MRRSSDLTRHRKHETKKKKQGLCFDERSLLSSWSNLLMPFKRRPTNL